KPRPPARRMRSRSSPTRPKPCTRRRCPNPSWTSPCHRPRRNRTRASRPGKGWAGRDWSRTNSVVETVMLSWESLVCLTDADLAAHDVAAIDLACAAGLPGAEGLDVEQCLAMLDAWAQHVGQETARCAAQFERDPAAFDNSWAYFRVLVLATVLQ